MPTRRYDKRDSGIPLIGDGGLQYSGDIGKALITTWLGLVVAIPAMIRANRWLSGVRITSD